MGVFFPLHSTGTVLHNVHSIEATTFGHQYDQGPSGFTIGRPCSFLARRWVGVCRVGPASPLLPSPIAIAVRLLSAVRRSYVLSTSRSEVFYLTDCFISGKKLLRTFSTPKVTSSNHKTEVPKWRTLHLQSMQR